MRGISALRWSVRAHTQQSNALEDAQRHGTQIGRVKRATQRAQLVQHAACRPCIGFRVVWLATQDLGRHAAWDTRVRKPAPGFQLRACTLLTRACARARAGHVCALH